MKDSENPATLIIYRSVVPDSRSALQGYTKITQGLCLNSLAELEEAFYRPVTINGEPLRRGDLLVFTRPGDEEAEPEAYYVGERRFQPVHVRTGEREAVIRSWEEKECLYLRENQAPCPTGTENT